MLVLKILNTYILKTTIFSYSEDINLLTSNV